MTQQEIYEELKELAGQKGVAVRLETGDFTGGLCLVDNKRVILINRRHDFTRRINVLARSLYAVGLDDVFMKPALRELIDDEVAIGANRE